jgi:hypothetical protein
MNSLMDEINRLREEIESIKSTLAEHDITTKGKSRGNYSSRYENNRLGLSAARLITSGPSSAIRPWLNSWKLRNSVFSQIGIKSTGFMTGFLGGLWTFGVDALLTGLSKLFHKQRSPLMDAPDVQEIRYMDDYDTVKGHERSIGVELYRGRGMRPLLRDEIFSADSLERQIKRGVVGL